MAQPNCAARSSGYVPLDEAIIVTPEALERAFLVWMRVLPKHIWRELEKQKLLDAAKRSTGERFDPEREVAKHMAAQFVRANWEVSYPEPIAPGTQPTRREV